MSLWCCDCCLKQKLEVEFKCKQKGTVKPKSICSKCYWDATISTDMDFLEHYATVVAQLRRNLTFMHCRRCELTLSSSFFSEDRSRKSTKSLICRDCNAEACELSRIKKRIWAEEDEHYKVPGGMGSSKKKRLEAMYKSFGAVDDERVKEGLVEMYKEQLSRLGLPEGVTGDRSLLKSM